MELVGCFVLVYDSDSSVDLESKNQIDTVPIVLASDPSRV